MTQAIRYIIDEQGEQVGVILDLDAYQQLTTSTADPDLLIGLSQAELEALAESQLASAAQTRLDTLLTQNKDQHLSVEETAELDHLLEQIDQLTILKTRARYTLQQQTLLSLGVRASRNHF